MGEQVKENHGYLTRKLSQTPQDWWQTHPMAQEEEVRTWTPSKYDQDRRNPHPHRSRAWRQHEVPCSPSRLWQFRLANRVRHQFIKGRLLAKVSSRPGQSGRCDGYIIEGVELK